MRIFIMKSPVFVPVALIKKKGKYLITQRPHEAKYNSGEWEFPGGKLNHGEHPAKCLEREILEELGIVVKAIKLFGISSYLYKDGRHIILLGFHCKHISGKIQNKEIMNWAYVPPKKMKKYNISLTDQAFVKELNLRGNLFRRFLS